MRTFLFVLILSPITITAHATEYSCGGKVVSKGEAITTLVNNPKAECVKTDRLAFDKDKGLVNAKKK